jgi:hypothetical protein
MTARIRTAHGQLFPLKVGRLSAVERIITGRVSVRIDSKGYLVFKSGFYRDRRVHSVVAEAMLGRKLRPDEDCHHEDTRKLNCDPSNLRVIGKEIHGWMSARQHWFVPRVIADR